MYRNNFKLFCLCLFVQVLIYPQPYSEKVVFIIIVFFFTFNAFKNSVVLLQLREFLENSYIITQNT